MFYLDGFDGSVADNGLYFTPDGQTLVSAGEDTRVRLWDLTKRKVRKTLKGHKQFASGLCLIPGTTLAASGSWDETVCIWDYVTGKKVKRFKLGASVIALDASPDGKTLVGVGGSWFVWGAGNPIWRWDTTTWKMHDAFFTHETQIGVVRYSPDGKRIVTGAADKRVGIWDASTGEELGSLKHTGWIQAVAMFGQTLAVAAGQRLTLWDLPTGSEPANQRGVIASTKGTLLTVSFSPDGHLLATGGKDGCVRIWDLRTERYRDVFRWKIGEVHSVCFAPDGMTMAAGGVGKIVVWDVD